MTYTLDNTINPPIQIFPNTASKFSVNNNHISKGAESDITKPIIGIIGGTIDDAINNSFVNLNKGITLNVPIVNVKRNKFINNLIGLEMKPMLPSQSMGLQRTNFNCNYFETDNAMTRTGIEIKPGTQQLQFGFFIDENSYSLGGNVWPTTITNRSQAVIVNGSEVDLNDQFLGWQNPTNWTPMKNNSSNTLEFWRYKNEYVSNASLSNIVLRTPTQLYKCYATENGSFTEQPNVTYVEVCNEVSSLTDRIYFPTPLIKVNDSFKPALEKSKGTSIVLNKGKDYVIPNVSNRSFSEYQLFSITGLKLNISKERNDTGPLLRTNNLPSGVYFLVINTDNKIESIRIIVQ